MRRALSDEERGLGAERLDARMRRWSSWHGPPMVMPGVRSTCWSCAAELGAAAGDGSAR